MISCATIVTMSASAERMAMFPLSTVLFPQASISLHVFEPRYQALVADCLAGDRTFGVVLIRRGREVGGGDERHDVGTVAHIVAASPYADGRWALACQGGERLKVVEWLADGPYPAAMVEIETRHSPTPDDKSADFVGAKLDAAMSSVRRTWALLSEAGRAPALPSSMVLDPDPDTAGWQLISAAPLSAYDAQRLLEIDDLTERLECLRTLVDDLSSDLIRMLAGK